jgi:hypothetical protein
LYEEPPGLDPKSKIRIIPVPISHIYGIENWVSGFISHIYWVPNPIDIQLRCIDN